MDNNYEPLVFHSVENKNDFFSPKIFASQSFLKYLHWLLLTHIVKVILVFSIVRY